MTRKPQTSVKRGTHSPPASPGCADLPVFHQRLRDRRSSGREIRGEADPKTGDGHVTEHARKQPRGRDPRPAASETETLTPRGANRLSQQKENLKYA